jgi:hypothetical protein
MPSPSIFTLVFLGVLSGLGGPSFSPFTQEITMNSLVPLISIRTKGPLGLVHLPRLWLKMRLAAKGKLAEGYRAGEGGFDGRLLEALGIELAAATAFVSAAQPSYVAFEAWVKENAEPESLTEDAINTFNEQILTRSRPEPAELLATVGLPPSDDAWLVTDLNNLDDWHTFHLALSDGA